MPTRFPLSSKEKINNGSNEDVGMGYGTMCVPLAFANVYGPNYHYLAPSSRTKATHWCLSYVFLMSFLYQSFLRVQLNGERKDLLAIEAGRGWVRSTHQAAAFTSSVVVKLLLEAESNNQSSVPCG